MEQGSFVGIIQELTDRALWEVRNVLDCVPDNIWNKEYCEMPLWKHVYHMLHSLDQWYINPDSYREPYFHTADLNNLDKVCEEQLSRSIVNEYYESIKRKIKDYDQALTDEQLLLKPDSCKWTRFTLILAQYRHLHSHMGIIMGFVIEATGKWPRVLGLAHEFPKEEYDKYF